MCLQEQILRPGQDWQPALLCNWKDWSHRISSVFVCQLKSLRFHLYWAKNRAAEKRWKIDRIPWYDEVPSIHQAPGRTAAVDSCKERACTSVQVGRWMFYIHHQVNICRGEKSGSHFQACCLLLLLYHVAFDFKLLRSLIQNSSEHIRADLHRSFLSMRRPMQCVCCCFCRPTAEAPSVKQ